MKIRTYLGIALLALATYSLYSYCFDLDILPSKNPLSYHHESASGGKKHKIGIVVQKVTLGDREVAQRYKIAAENLGWDAYVLKYKAKFGRYRLTAWVTQTFNDIINYFFEPELLIVFYPSYYPVLSYDVPKYLVFFGNINNTLKVLAKQRKETTDFFDDYQNIGNYDGYIDINDNSEWVKELSNFSTQPFTPHKKGQRKIVIHGYPTTFATEYAPLKYERLFFCGGNWDQLRSSENYKKIILGLEQKGYLDVYGPAESWKYISTAYKGFIESNGYALIKKIREAGVALILHSDYHNLNGLPSARIFETAASGAIAISDQNAFVKKEFGDCVLYIDPSKDSNDVIQQIDNHMKWIKANPDLAEKKARCAHNIFINKFTLEKILLELYPK